MKTAAGVVKIALIHVIRRDKASRINRRKGNVIHVTFARGFDQFRSAPRRAKSIKSPVKDFPAGTHR